MFMLEDFKILKNADVMKSILTGGANIFFVLLALNLLSVNLVIVDSYFMRITTVYLLIGLIIFNVSFRKIFNILKRKNIEETSFNKTIVGILLIVFSFILLLGTWMQIFWLASVPILICGLNLTLKGIKIKRKELYLLSIASFVYVIFYVLLQTIPILWYSLQQFSMWFSSAVGSIIGKPMLLGPSVSGLWIVMIFFLFSCCVFILTGLKKKHFIINIIGLAICWIIYLIILGFVGFKTKSDALNLIYLIFFFCFIPTYYYLMNVRFSDENPLPINFRGIKSKKIIKNVALWALVLLFISSVLITAFPCSGFKNMDCENKSILLYAQNMLGSWDVPEYGKYGKMASGMFGLLPYYLNDLGYKVSLVVENRVDFLNITLPVYYENISRYVNITNYATIVESPTITVDLLDDYDAFVVINLNKTFSSDEHNAIWSFVEKGGSLLVLGDHTDISGMMSPLNLLLEPVGISYRFDDALPIDYKFRWLTCYQFMNHPVTYKIDNTDEIQISVGASLDINYASFPIIVGRYGLSDMGDRLNAEKAFLGDYEYNPGEHIGDIILAAGAYYGNGKVVVFGDTSSFQNLAISSSLPLVNGVFSWLGSQSTSFIFNMQVILSLILLVGAFVIYLKYKKNRIHFAFFPLVLCFGLIISAFANPIMLQESEMKGKIVYIDASHIERFDIKSYEEDSLTGLMLSLIRNDYLPIILKEFSTDKIDNCDILVFNAPTKAFSSGEVDYLKEFMNKGGLVILSTSFEDKEASMPLLKEFSLDIDEIPLGPVPYVEEDPEAHQTEPRFSDSWPIIGDIGKDENDTTYPTYPFYSVEIENKEYVLMTFTQHGAGGLLFISDTKFLLDKNIETLEDYWPGNIQFLYHIINEMVNKGVLQ